MKLPILQLCLSVAASMLQSVMSQTVLPSNKQPLASEPSGNRSLSLSEGLHLDKFPPGTRVAASTKERRNGILIVQLLPQGNNKTDFLAAVDVEGKPVPGYHFELPRLNVIQHMMWLDDNHFACTASGRKYSFYTIYSIKKNSDGNYINLSCEGSVYGSVQFIATKNALSMMREDGKKLLEFEFANL